MAYTKVELDDGSNDLDSTVAGDKTYFSVTDNTINITRKALVNSITANVVVTAKDPQATVEYCATINGTYKTVDDQATINDLTLNNTPNAVKTLYVKITAVDGTYEIYTVNVVNPAS